MDINAFDGKPGRYSAKRRNENMGLEKVTFFEKRDKGKKDAACIFERRVMGLG